MLTKAANIENCHLDSRGAALHLLLERTCRKTFTSQRLILNPSKDPAARKLLNILYLPLIIKPPFYCCNISYLFPSAIAI